MSHMMLKHLDMPLIFISFSSLITAQDCRTIVVVFLFCFFKNPSFLLCLATSYLLRDFFRHHGKNELYVAQIICCTYENWYTQLFVYMQSWKCNMAIFMWILCHMSYFWCSSIYYYKLDISESSASLWASSHVTWPLAWPQSLFTIFWLLE